jgi:hypothetical protein
MPFPIKHLKKGNEKYANHLGIDEEREGVEQHLKMTKGRY